ncbi:hypothetical protein [Trichloromonas sp.]|uniref:hypothetical protein n=1 Tax=Trichloromonas sp. TaxID=3069249 RepID=UPI002A46EC25|nr:hypothetical protein [Trichloromonas sp.]
MNFYLVFTKSKKKFDKYVKVNKIRNKVIIDIKQQLEEYDIHNNYDIYKSYFNLLIYNKIVQSFSKNRDIYYIPNFSNKKLDVNDIFKIKKVLDSNIKFNILIFFDEFKNDEDIYQSILSNMNIFDASQILKSY